MTTGAYSGTSPSFQFTVAGTYYLFAELDSTFAFAETSDANNVMAAASPVTVSGATVIDNSGGGLLHYWVRLAPLLRGRLRQQLYLQPGQHRFHGELDC